MSTRTPLSPAGIPRSVITLIIVLVISILVIAILASLSSNFFYLFSTVEQNEVGARFRGGKLYDVVGPGIYSDFGLYVRLRKISVKALPFNVVDEEIITSDKQRIGISVSGDIFRPNFTQKDVLFTKWEQYSIFFMDDQAALNKVSDLAKQAMKVCVGERKFDDAIIGTARDALRACVDDELSELATNIGLEIQNVVVPNVVLSPEVQAALDSIVQSRLATEKAAQDKLKADAEALANQAFQEGQIRVEQSRIQEQTRQETILAQLEQEKLAAQRAVIEAQKSNDLFSAQQDLEINRALALAAVEKAKVDLAQQITLADLYANHPDYLQLQIALANASALKMTDKIIFTPTGMVPNLVLAGPSVLPTVETTSTTQTVNPEPSSANP
jgi:hypothetical protein